MRLACVFAAMFVDLNVPLEDPDAVAAGSTSITLESARSRLELLVQCALWAGGGLVCVRLMSRVVAVDYDAAAVNHIVAGKLSPQDACSYKAVDLASGPASATSVKLALRDRRNLRQLTRLTVILADHTANHQLTASNPVVASYDLLAVTPTTEKTFLCTTASCRHAWPRTHVHLSARSCMHESRDRYHRAGPFVALAFPRSSRPRQLGHLARHPL